MEDAGPWMDVKDIFNPFSHLKQQQVEGQILDKEDLEAQYWAPVTSTSPPLTH